jgi:hypothetical protein
MHRNMRRYWREKEKGESSGGKSDGGMAVFFLNSVISVTKQSFAGAAFLTVCISSSI